MAGIPYEQLSFCANSLQNVFTKSCQSLKKTNAFAQKVPQPVLALWGSQLCLRPVIGASRIPVVAGIPAGIPGGIPDAKRKNTSEKPPCVHQMLPKPTKNMCFWR